MIGLDLLSYMLMIFHIDFHMNFNQFLSKFFSNQTFYIFFKGVFSTVLLSTLIFCLLGQINSIATGDGICGLLCLRPLEEEPLAIN